MIWLLSPKPMLWTKGEVRRVAETQNGGAIYKSKRIRFDPAQPLLLSAVGRSTFFPGRVDRYTSRPLVLSPACLGPDLSNGRTSPACHVGRHRLGSLNPTTIRLLASEPGGRASNRTTPRSSSDQARTTGLPCPVAGQRRRFVVKVPSAIQTPKSDRKAIQMHL